MNHAARSGFLALFAAAAVALAGCASMEDFATNPEKEKTRKGAGYGEDDDGAALRDDDRRFVGGGLAVGGDRQRKGRGHERGAKHGAHERVPSQVGAADGHSDRKSDA